MSRQVKSPPARRFRVWDAVGALALVAAGVWMSVRPPAIDAGALRIEPAHVDLGRLRPLEMADARFTLTNTGADPLVISKVKTSCGCVGPDWTNKTIDPGRSDVLTLSFHSGSAVGVKRHEAQLVLAGPDGGPDRRVAVTLGADVIPDYEMTAAAFDFGSVKAGARVSAVLELRRVGQQTALKIERWKTSHAALTLVRRSGPDGGRSGPDGPTEGTSGTNSPTPAPNGDRLLYDVVLDPARYSAEVFSGEVVLFTNSKSMGRKVLPVKARLLRDFRVEPDSVLFCLTDDASADLTREIHVAGPKGLRPEDLAIESAPSEVQAAVTVATDGSAGLSVALTLSASRVHASFEKELTIRAGDLGSVVVPIRCLDLRTPAKGD